MNWQMEYIDAVKKHFANAGYKISSGVTNEILFGKQSYLFHLFIDLKSKEIDGFMELIPNIDSKSIYIDGLIKFYGIKKSRNSLSPIELVEIVNSAIHEYDKILKDIDHQSFLYTVSVIDAPIHVEIRKAWDEKNYPLLFETTKKLTGSLTNIEKKWVEYAEKKI